jgi:hypothetical protein
MHPKHLLIGFFALLLPFGAVGAENRPATLGAYGVDTSRVTVSGLSSGAYMAVQLSVAYSSLFSGVAVIAGGPYGCADTGGAVAVNVTRALGPCMAGSYTWTQKWQCIFWWWTTCPGADRPDADAAIELARQYARSNAIDPLENLRRERVFLLSGRKDTKVVPAVVNTLRQFYEAFVPSLNIREEDLDGVAHTFPTDTFKQGNACSKSDPPFVSDCKYDAAGKLLAFLHGGLKARNDGPPEGSLIQFDQTRFFPPSAATGMADVGYAYVPKTCTAAGARCALHVALHGCLQTAESIGTKFVEGTGYNRWADTNGIIVLYPQIGKSKLASNPQDCWDWWGYTGSTWLEKRAPQMQAIAAMVNHMSARPQ